MATAPDGGGCTKAQLGDYQVPGGRDLAQLDGIESLGLVPLDYFFSALTLADSTSKPSFGKGRDELTVFL